MAYQPLYLDVSGILVAESPFHVGTGENWAAATDNPLARRDGSPAKECILPGSSLKGVLRAHLGRECRLLGCTTEDVQRLFGSANGTEGKQGWLTFPDAIATQMESPCEIRDHVRINRKTGAADAHAKFDEEIGLPSTRFQFRCIYEGEDDSACLRLLDEAIHALERGRIRVGAGAGRGYGLVKLVEGTCKVRAFRRDEAEGLQSFLSYRVDPAGTSAVDWPGSLKIDSATPLPDVDARSSVTLRLRIECEGPVLVRSSIPPLTRSSGERTQTSHADAVFFCSQGKPVLPGSSLRGVCRTRAEKICASIGWEPCRVEELFGSAKMDGSGRRGLLEFSDAPAVAGDELYLDHVAIDRITGFAAQGKKFAAVALASPVFAGTVTVHYGPFHSCALALWALVLRDLIEGYRIWIGSGTTRGYGKVSRARVTGISGTLAGADGRQYLRLDVAMSGIDLQDVMTTLGLGK